MNIKLFFEISKDFFDSIYSLDLEEDIVEKKEEEKDLELELEIDESDDEEDICGCNLCHITGQLLSFINSKNYKKLNANKVD